MINIARCGRDECQHVYVATLLNCPKCGNVTRKLHTEDPARALIGLVEPTTTDVHRVGCYICEDSEFAQLGLPLCRKCKFCEDGHVAADDCICDRCGKDIRE